ncbi:uncharacterized protein LOC117528417 isoform X2 [Thalassophryne amazonica]|uniref:uncharacterized protein LOC117528417 isoform X2 n=1 Tax=Thalassophryne amazonica TaxID=390379 RepID=UPI00147237A8|nr:uncharacterized protein LOC117528417 isoform X2 [Thalassophryne amazonica]
MACSYVDGLDKDARQQYLAKLEAARLELCPYTQPEGVWKDDPKTWPKVEYGDIYSYLINSPGPFTHNQMKYYKSLDAYCFFRSGWVQTMYSQITPNGNTVFKAGVQPDQQTNCPLHSPLGECCSHIAAVLFKIEDAVRQGCRTTDCTDTECKWNTCFMSKLQPAPDPEPADGVQPCTEADRQRFISSLLQCGAKPVGLSLFAETCERFSAKTPSSVLSQTPQPVHYLYENNSSALQYAVVPALSRSTKIPGPSENSAGGEEQNGSDRLIPMDVNDSVIKEESVDFNIKMIKEEHAYFMISEITEDQTDFRITEMKEEPADFLIMDIKEETQDYQISEIKEEQ